jgi:hypothetical protein
MPVSAVSVGAVWPKRVVHFDWSLRMWDWFGGSWWWTLIVLGGVAMLAFTLLGGTTTT